jgi:hypothetical protein
LIIIFGTIRKLFRSRLDQFNVRPKQEMVRTPNPKPMAKKQLGPSYSASWFLLLTAWLGLVIDPGENGGTSGGTGRSDSRSMSAPSHAEKCPSNNLMTDAQRT